MLYYALSVSAGNNLPEVPGRDEAILARMRVNRHKAIGERLLHKWSDKSPRDSGYYVVTGPDDAQFKRRRAVVPDKV